MLRAAANIEGTSTLRKMEQDHCVAGFECSLRHSQTLGAYQPILLAVVFEDVVVATVIAALVSATWKWDGKAMRGRNSQTLGAYQPILLAVVLEDVVVATVIVILVSATWKLDGKAMRGRNSRTLGA